MKEDMEGETKREQSEEVEVDGGGSRLMGRPEPKFVEQGVAGGQQERRQRLRPSRLRSSQSAWKRMQHRTKHARIKRYSHKSNSVICMAGSTFY